jgi:hypothetical protein
MVISGFKASNGWMNFFKKRRNISYRKVCGENGYVNEENVDHWINKSLPGFIHRYEPRDIFNLHETAREVLTLR